jgi:predicted transcriptional regulator
MTVKEEVKEMLEKLPDNATFDEVHYRLLVREKIDRGVADLEAGRVHTEEEMEATFKKWLGE